MQLSRKQIISSLKERARRDPVAWIEKNFYIEDTQAPIVLAPYQRAVLRYIFRRDPVTNHYLYNIVFWSQPKKSGKTTIAGAVARWAAETWGRFGEILCVGNDADQAKGRAYKALSQSIQLDPKYRPNKRQLPGRWTVGAKETVCYSTGTEVKAIASDYKGEAGANPILSVWTELWGFVHEADLRFWAELAPSPTRPVSMRWVETYAGYHGESELLYNLYETAVLNGRQITAGELGDLTAFAESPNPDSPVPIFVNPEAGIVAFWDTGEQGRRMDWQHGERGEAYYRSEEATQTPKQFRRLHFNEWVSAESEFVRVEWWDACTNPLPLLPGDPTPLVVALDAAVTGDSFAMVVGSRDPDRPVDGVAIRLSRKWEPPPGGAIDYAPIEQECRDLAADFNVVEFTYDPYQLHDFATRLRNAGVGHFREFSQGEERLKSDKGLFDLIVQRRIRHDGNLELREHIVNSNSKQASGEDTRLRIVKKSANRRIDLTVATSMMSAEVLRLYI